MITPEIIDNQMNVLIELGNAKTGKTDTTVTEVVNSLCARYLPEGTLEGLENGWDVMFYDENNNGLAFYSIKKGHTINAPIYTVKAWHNKNDKIIRFPFEPTEDLIVYANNNTYAKILYRHYGIDQVEYPLLMLGEYNKQFEIRFAKELQTSNDSLGGIYARTSYKNMDYTSIDTIITSIINNIPAITSDYEGSYINNKSHLHLNFNPSEWGSTGTFDYVDLNV